MRSSILTAIILVHFFSSIATCRAQAIPLPQTPTVFPHYLAIEKPVTSSSAIQSYPIGVGEIATGGDEFSLQVGLSRFSNAMDLYLALSIVEFSSELYLFNEKSQWVPLSLSTPQPWKRAIKGPLDEVIITHLPKSSLPDGDIFIYLIGAPANTLDTFYLWHTSFNKQSGGASLLNPLNDGLLILNEISPWPSDGKASWIELLNPTIHTVALKDYAVTCSSGVSQTFDNSSESLSSGERYLIEIPEDVPFNLKGDRCILTLSNTVVDAISWGMPPVTADGSSSMAVAGAALMPETGVFFDDEPLFPADGVCMRIPGTWSLGSQDWLGATHWRIRSSDNATPGSLNSLPKALIRLPPQNSRLASRFYLTVTGITYADQTRFQIALNDDFDAPVLDETVHGDSLLVEKLDAGAYYWRFKIVSPVESAWYPAWELTRTAYDLDQLIRAADREKVVRAGTVNNANQYVDKASHVRGDADSDDPHPDFSDETGTGTVIKKRVIGCPHITQHKDTGMVCMDGCLESGDFNWQDAHPFGEFNRDPGHNDVYCSRAALSMVAALNGCTLSQDRITYYIHEEVGSSRGIDYFGHLGDPYKDLAHGEGTYDADIMAALAWIYNQPVSTIRGEDYSPELFDDHDPSDMDTLVDFIDDGRPVIRNIRRSPTGHSTLIDGYAVVRDESGLEIRYIHVLDPWNIDDVQWVSLLIVPEPNYWIFPPETGAPMRCDEPELTMDSDGDNLVDFDEIHRFETDPDMADTDEDGLDDMVDMKGYIFDLYGNHLDPQKERDVDGDGAPKEIDPDNDKPDNDGVNDGCEDANRDGWFNSDGNESDNFNSSDDFTVINPSCFRGVIRLSSETSSSNPMLTTVRVNEMLLIRRTQPFTFDAYIYDTTWQLSSDPLSIAGVTSVSSGEADMQSKITIEIDETGHYRLTTDCEPRVVSYTITTSGYGTTTTKSEDFHLGFADHHYEYVSPEAPPEVWAMLESAGKPNVFEGDIEVTEEGLILSGTDHFDMPISGMTGSLDRQWRIVIDIEEL